MNKKLISLLTVTTATTLLAACGGDGGTAAEGGDTTKELTIMAPYIETEPPEPGNQLELALEEETGFNITVNWTPNTSYEDKMNVTLASEDLPEIMVIQGKSGGFIKSANAGAFWELSDYLDEFPNLAAADPNIVNNSSVNGEVYGIYRRRDLMRTSVVIRQDWLDNLGLEMPETVDDLYEVAKAFTENDPDGNGEDDTTGLIIPQWPGSINSNSPYDVLATWFGAPNAWGEQDGKLIPSFKTDEYRESLTFLKDMVDNGYINRDFATLSADNWNDPFVSGDGGIIIDTYSRSSQIKNILKDSHPEEYHTMVSKTGNLKGPDGELYSHPTDGYSGFLVIPKSSVETEEELREVLSFIDATNSVEAQKLMNNGIEGVNYENVSDGFYDLIDPKTDESQQIDMAVKSYSQLGTNVGGNEFLTARPSTEYDQKDWEERQALMAHDEEYAVFNPAAPYISATYSEKGAQLDNIIADARIQYIAGQIDEQGWQDAVDLWSNSGGTDVEAEMNELYQNAQ